MKNNHSPQSEKSSLRWFLAAIAGLPFAALVFGQRLRAQGVLTPPGAPAPTMKTLDQLEPRTPISALPFTITSSGSYYVTANLTGAAGQHGITINADNVTLDLGGFELVGPGSGTTSAVRVINAHTNATIRNGSARGWLSNTIVAETAACTEMQVENVRVFSGGISGIVLGNNGTARGCVVRACVAMGISGGTSCQIIDCTTIGQTGASGDGINVAAFSTLVRCVAGGNANRGIVTGGSCTLSDCTASSNTSSGIILGSQCAADGCAANGNGSVGINVSSMSTLTRCTASSNTGNGVSVGIGCVLENCSASSNSSAGISTNSHVTLRGCVAYDNDSIGISAGVGNLIADCTVGANRGTAGISASSACTIVACTVRSNTSNAATSAGISASTECHISRCVVSNTATTAGTLTSTTGMGIIAAGSCTIESCTVQGCAGDGIRVSSFCLVIGNNCDANGFSTGDGAGIHSTASNNRIEGNNVTNNDRGIEVGSTASLIIKNSAATNGTDYVIAASNRYGAIINITATGAASVNGNSAASTLTSTDPWANYSY